MKIESTPSEATFCSELEVSMRCISNVKIESTPSEATPVLRFYYIKDFLILYYIKD
jgi:hypothetical protein